MPSVKLKNKDLTAVTVDGTSYPVKAGKVTVPTTALAALFDLVDGPPEDDPTTTSTPAP